MEEMKLTIFNSLLKYLAASTSVRASRIQRFPILIGPPSCKKSSQNVPGRAFSRFSMLKCSPSLPKNYQLVLSIKLNAVKIHDVIVGECRCFKVALSLIFVPTSFPTNQASFQDKCCCYAISTAQVNNTV